MQNQSSRGQTVTQYRMGKKIYLNNNLSEKPSRKTYQDFLCRKNPRNSAKLNLKPFKTSPKIPPKCSQTPPQSSKNPSKIYLKEIRIQNTGQESRFSFPYNTVKPFRNSSFKFSRVCPIGLNQWSD